MQLKDRIGRRLKLHDLHVLTAVVQTGSMRKAATRLNTTQPSVSRSIADLENAVGVPLLDRNPHGVEPTAYGRALLDGSMAMFDDLRQAVKNIEFLADPTAGEIRIGCIPPLGSSFVSAVVDRLSQCFPRIIFHLVTANTEALHRDLHDRNVDVLVARRFGPVADEREGFEYLFDDSYVVVGGAQHPAARRRRTALADLMHERWVLPPPENPLGSIAMEAFRASGFDYPRTIVFAVHPDVRTSLLATGHFLTIFSTAYLRFLKGRPELKVLPVNLPLARVQIGIVTLKNRTLSPVAQLFIEHAREVAKPLAKRK